MPQVFTVKIEPLSTGQVSQEHDGNKQPYRGLWRIYSFIKLNYLKYSNSTKITNYTLIIMDKLLCE